MRAEITDIVPGRILWEVSCICGCECKPKLSKKVIVTSKPYMCSDIGLKFDSVDVWICSDDQWEQKNGSHFLSTYNIKHETNHYRVHNLHRMFSTKESAELYIAECKAGVFSDKEDQEFYDFSSTAQYKKRRDEDFAIFNDMF